jgi:hypothetical protein
MLPTGKKALESRNLNQSRTLILYFQLVNPAIQLEYNLQATLFI